MTRTDFRGRFPEMLTKTDRSTCRMRLGSVARQFKSNFLESLERKEAGSIITSHGWSAGLRPEATILLLSLSFLLPPYYSVFPLFYEFRFFYLRSAPRVIGDGSRSCSFTFTVTQDSTDQIEAKTFIIPFTSDVNINPEGWFSIGIGFLVGTQIDGT